MPGDVKRAIKAGTARKCGGRFTRSRSGCRTCKTRRIKCDEGRPGCLRCSSTGRTCDGYGLLDAQSLLPSTTHVICEPTTTLFLSSRSRHAQSCFSWFTRRASKKIPGIFASDFWNTLVLQISTQETAVLDSLIALSSAHKRGMLLSHDGLLPCTPDMRESFMLQHYNAAIVQVRRHLETADKESVRVAAIVCLVFICFEFLRGNVKTGINHLENGLRLLPILNTQSGLDECPFKLKAHNESIDDALAEAFLRLYVYSAFFARYPHHVSIVLQDYEGHSFPTIVVARQHLDELFNRIDHLEEQVRDLQQGPHCSSDFMQQVDQRRIQNDLDYWLRLYKSSYTRLSNDNLETSLSLRLLLVYHSMAYIMAGTCLATDELSYDDFHSHFALIIARIKQLWEAAAPNIAASVSSGSCTEKFSFSTDMGVIWPLFYTIQKCRCPEIRREALKLLAPVSHQEGAWNGPLAISVAHRLIEVEESEFYLGSAFTEWSPDDSAHHQGSIPPLPESCRISEVYMEPIDHLQGDAKLVYKRRNSHGGWITVQETVSHLGNRCFTT